MSRVLILIVATAGLSACSTHEVTTAGEWCEQLRGVDLIEKNRPFWAVLPEYTLMEMRSVRILLPR